MVELVYDRLFPEEWYHCYATSIWNLDEQLKHWNTENFCMTEALKHLKFLYDWSTETLKFLYNWSTEAYTCARHTIMRSCFLEINHSLLLLPLIFHQSIHLETTFDMAYTGKYQNCSGNQSCPLALTYSTAKKSTTHSFCFGSMAPINLQRNLMPVYLNSDLCPPFYSLIL